MRIPTEKCPVQVILLLILLGLNFIFNLVAWVYSLIKNAPDGFFDVLLHLTPLLGVLLTLAAFLLCLYRKKLGWWAAILCVLLMLVSVRNLITLLLGVALYSYLLLCKPTRAYFQIGKP